MLRHIRGALVTYLLRVKGAERKTVLDLMADEKLIAPPILPREAFASIAHSVIEVCQEWRSQ